MTASACRKAVRRSFRAGIGLILAFHAFGYVPVSAGATTASWYDNASAKREKTCIVGKRGGCLTASGRELDDSKFAIASWDYDFGTRLKVCRADVPNKRTSKGTLYASQHISPCAVGIVSDRGPSRRLYRQGRILDLSQAMFQALAPLAQGVIEVSIEGVD